MPTMTRDKMSRARRAGEWAFWLVIMTIAFKQLFRGTVGEFSAHGEESKMIVLYSRFAFFVPFIISVFALLFPRSAAILLVVSGAIGYWYLWNIPNAIVVANRFELSMEFLPWLGAQAFLALIIFLIRWSSKTR
jgi:hypothetical protein